MKYYLIAGEASGDLHGSNLMRALRQKDPDAEFRVWGGDRMHEAGGTVVKHIRELAFMGFAEVAANLRTILRNIRLCKDDISQWQPDALILIDYPGFNMRIAKWAKANGFRIYYYISPQIWAWNTRRVHQLGRNTDRIFVILPFEKDFYQRYGYEVDYVGHPLLDVIDEFQAQPLTLKTKEDNRPIIALLPGSRRQEISRMLREMLGVIPEFPDHQFALAGAPGIDPAFYQNILQQARLPAGQSPALLFDQTYDLLARAQIALVASGTATLETALFRVPQIVCYRGSIINYWLFRALIKVKFISLVNLIMDKRIVEEMIQADLHKNNLVKGIKRLQQPEVRTRLAEEYEKLREKLGTRGASEKTAKLIVELLSF